METVFRLLGAHAHKVPGWRHDQAILSGVCVRAGRQDSSWKQGGWNHPSASLHCAFSRASRAGPCWRAWFATGRLLWCLGHRGGNGALAFSYRLSFGASTCKPKSPSQVHAAMSVPTLGAKKRQALSWSSTSCCLVLHVHALRHSLASTVPIMRGQLHVIAHSHSTIRFVSRHSGKCRSLLWLSFRFGVYMAPQTQHACECWSPCLVTSCACLGGDVLHQPVRNSSVCFISKVGRVRSLSLFRGIRSTIDCRLWSMVSDITLTSQTVRLD